MFNSCKVSSTFLFTFSVPLAVRIWKGQPYLGYISSYIRCTILSADLSGTRKASSHPELMSIKKTIHLFPISEVGYGPDKSSPTLAMGKDGMPVFWSGGWVLYYSSYGNLRILLYRNIISSLNLACSYFCLITSYVLCTSICPSPSWYCCTTINSNSRGIYRRSLGPSVSPSER